MYSRRVQGKTLEFGVSGKLLRNALVMYDRQTDSLWSQFLGKAVEGPLAGEELTYVPARLTTWEEWKQAHPDTVALVKGYSGEFDPYNSYYLSSAAGVHGRTVSDDRLPTKEFVIGVALGEEAVAYPYRELSQSPVVNDTVGGTPIVVVFDPQGSSAAVFDRRVQGHTLTFQAVQGTKLRDEETGSLWNGLSGMAISGELEGAQLEGIQKTSAFWFGWVDYHPDTRVFEGG